MVVYLFGKTYVGVDTGDIRGNTVGLEVLDDDLSWSSVVGAVTT